MEEWRTCVYNGEIYKNYEVSNYGNVRSLNYKRGKEPRLLKFKDNGRGYLNVNLCKNGKVRTCYVHRLVAFAFIPNDDVENKTEVNHIDENKYNNCVENLEWTTKLQNVQHGTGSERMGKAHGKRVRCVETQVIYDSVTDTSRKTGLCLTSIWKCCTGKQETTGGLHWEYVD